MKNCLLPQSQGFHEWTTARHPVDYRTVCPAVHRIGLAAGVDVVDRSDPDAGPTNGGVGVASGGAEQKEEV